MTAPRVYKKWRLDFSPANRMLGLHKNQQTSVENITLFAQIARLIPRFIVEEAAKKFKSNKGASRLDTWTHAGVNFFL